MATEQTIKRGRPRLPRESVRSERFTVLLSPTELLALNNYAARVGLTASEVVRRCVMALIANERRQAS